MAVLCIFLGGPEDAPAREDNAKKYAFYAGRRRPYIYKTYADIGSIVPFRGFGAASKKYEKKIWKIASW